MTRADEIVRLSHLWLKTRYSPRENAVRMLCEEAGFPRAMAEEILDLNFRKITAVNLNKALRKAEKLGLFRASDKSAGLVLPSNVPDPIIVHVFLNLLFGCDSFVKLPQGLKGFGGVFLESIKEESKLFRARLTVTDSKDEFFDNAHLFQQVRAFGDDATLHAVQKKLPKKVRFTGYGHRLSAGIVFKSALANPGKRLRMIRDLVRDIWLYDQRGCLSPQLFLVEGDEEQFVGLLSSELEKLVKRMGLPERPYDASLERRIFFDRLSAQALRGDIEMKGHAEEAQGPFLYRIVRGSFTGGCGGLVVGVKGFADLKETQKTLAPVWKKLQGLVTAGSPSECQKVRALFRTSPVKWFAAPGNLQDPPLEALL